LPLLLAAVVAVMLPTLLSSTAEQVKDLRAELALSRFESVLMLVCYGLFLLFQLVTHRWVGKGAGNCQGGLLHAAAGPGSRRLTQQHIHK
jgi:Ca2+/H+ antiporter